jgi:predicted anti-sigma-YlaC factor YlaD
MTCAIIQDLLPLYIDQICSPETKAAVEEHLKTCPECRRIHEAMIREFPAATTPSQPVPEKSIYLRIRRQLGNLLLCAILFIAFLSISFGLVNEIGDHGWQPGLFAVVFVVPCTAFLLSMVSVIIMTRISYRPWFCWISAGITLAACIAGEIYALNHYSAQTEAATLIPYCGVIVLIFTVLSFFIARLYSSFCRR